MTYLEIEQKRETLFTLKRQLMSAFEGDFKDKISQEDSLLILEIDAKNNYEILNGFYLDFSAETYNLFTYLEYGIKGVLASLLGIVFVPLILWAIFSLGIASLILTVPLFFIILWIFSTDLLAFSKKSYTYRQLNKKLSNFQKENLIEAINKEINHVEQLVFSLQNNNEFVEN